MTIDQRRSRSRDDMVEELLRELNDGIQMPARVLEFERTAGDEVQGVVRSPETAVRVALQLAETGDWSTGLGVGGVRRPLPTSTRAASGPAFVFAREAVERAKSSAEGLAVGGPAAEVARDAEALVQLLAAVRRRRSPAGREVAQLLAQGLSQSDVAERLGITKQAVSQRARTAMWSHESRLLPLAGRLLAGASGSSS